MNALGMISIIFLVLMDGLVILSMVTREIDIMTKLVIAFSVLATNAICFAILGAKDDS